MQIESNNFRNLALHRRSSRDIATRSRGRTLPGTDEILSLANTPDVRAAEIARGKALIADPNYPSREQIKQVARVLARSEARRHTVSATAG